MQLPVAVSPLTREVVMGGPRHAVVVARYPTVVYLRQEPPEPTVLPVVTDDALLLPTALRLGVRSGEVVWPWAVGAGVTVGAGRVVGPGLELRAAREWRPTRVSSGLPAPGQARLELPRGGALGELATELTRTALAERPLGALVGRLVGAGAGLTPSGDDALCGVLLALRAWAGSPSPAGAVADAVGRARHRTNDLSASLLAAAADGYAVPQVVALVGALSDSDAADMTTALEAVLAIGHTSGSDLVAGLAGALRALDLPHPDRECSSSHRECSNPDRECSNPDRECSNPDRECSNPDRECSSSHRECTSSHRSPSLTPEGTPRA